MGNPEKKHSIFHSFLVVFLLISFGLKIKENEFNFFFLLFCKLKNVESMEKIKRRIMICFGSDPINAAATTTKECHWFLL